VYLLPKAIKGKTWDDHLLFGGQLVNLIQKAEASVKYGFHLGDRRKDS
jgi:hypothetical protein